MFKSYVQIALRNLWKYKGYTAINIVGLSIGMTCVMLILMYVRGELSVDGFHIEKDRIYRLNISTTNPNTGATNQRSIGPYRLADELKPDFPDFEQIVRVAPQGREMVEYKGEQFNESRFAFVDDNYFQVFDFTLEAGDPEKVLDDPFSVVLSRDVAQRYFGSSNPVGEVLRIRDRDFEVTGIMRAPPSNTQFQFDMLASMNCAQQVFSRIVMENWGEGFVSTFVLLPENHKSLDYKDRLASFTEVKMNEWNRFSPRIVLQSLPSLYLHSKDISSFVPGGDIVYVYAFSFIAIFILIIACINFMNLATARSSLRAKEVGLRKVVGAHRIQLMIQFLSESTFLSFISLLLALIFTRLALPFFNSLAETSLSFDLFNDKMLIVGLVAIALFVGLAAGSYPAVMLSGFKPNRVLSGNMGQPNGSGKFRKSLVTFQFMTSIFLIAVTGIVLSQINFCRNLDIGFEKDNVVLIGGTPLDMRGQYEQFTNELLSNPKIVMGAASSRVPPGRLSSSLKARPEGIPEDQQRGMQTIWTDFGFLETMGFEMASGRYFTRDFPSDAASAFILNEAAVKDLGWTNDNALGKTFGSSEIRDWSVGQWEEKDGFVIGVIKDVHFESLKEKIVPTIYFISPYMAWNYVVRIRSGETPKTIQFIEDTWKQFNPEVPFEYTFIDENYNQLYAEEERQGRIFGVFALLAILIACLGLVGLVSFTADQKKKEVGIRKVLGASSASIVIMLTREFTWLVVLAFILATPIAWYTMKEWLQDFAYHVTLGPGMFIVAGVMAIVIAWITVSLQTARSALMNPIEAIRNE